MDKLTKIEQTQSLQVLRAPENMAQLTDMLGDRAPHFVSSIVGLFATNTQLAECTPQSIVIAAVQGAAMDLSFDPNLGEAYMVPYNRKFGNKWIKMAQYQPGYKGLIQLALRTGQYKKLGFNVVTQKMFTALRNRVEASTLDPASETIRFFEMADFYPEFDNGKPVGYIAYFELANGFKKFVYWTAAKCLEHAKKYSKQQDKKGNLYGTWIDQQEAMCLKTVIRQLFKFGPKSKEMRTSLEADSKDLSSDYDRFNIPARPAIRAGHEDDDLFGEVPSNSSAELEQAYNAIDFVWDHYDIHERARTDSIKKHLGAQSLRECKDIDLLKKYAHDKELRCLQKIMKKDAKSPLLTEDERAKTLEWANKKELGLGTAQKWVSRMKETIEGREKAAKSTDKVYDDQTQQDLDLVKKVLGDKAAEGLKQAIRTGDDDEYNRLVQSAQIEQESLVEHIDDAKG
jgi:recombination protein RecT